MPPRANNMTADTASVRSVSSEDVSNVGVRGQCCVKASNPAYKRGRRLQLLQMLILPFIPILALIVQTGITLKDIIIYRQEVSDIEGQVRSYNYVYMAKCLCKHILIFIYLLQKKKNTYKILTENFP
ncbi:hypothetical protein C0J52_16534 [Blattella germanica]|nr:hypothetical protein C0J52_16534 [Blattella germanica]